jgi:hypothetical protein
MEFPVSGTKSEIYEKLKAKLGEAVSAGKIPALKELSWNDAGHQATASGPGFKAKITCMDGKVGVDLDLNFMLKAMRGQIEEQVKKSVQKIFG